MKTISTSVTNFRIQIVSDIHLEMRNNFKPLQVCAEFLALCGDIGYPDKSSYKEFLQWSSKNYLWVFLIAGNHEYYSKESMEDITEKIRSIAEEFPNIIFLENESILVNYQGGSVRVFGSTLWSDTLGNKKITRAMNDYTRIHKRIKDEEGKEKIIPVTTEITTDLHYLAVEKLKETISKSEEEGNNLVVLTHHLPSFRCIHEDYRGFPYNEAFASDLDYLIKPPIILWAHGHSHRFLDKMINGVRVVSNPLGYPGENTKKYHEYFSVFVTDRALWLQIDNL